MRPFLTLHHPERAKRYYEKGWWRADTFYSLLVQQASERPEKIAVRDGRRSLSWSEVLAWVDGVAAGFAAKGLVAGDRLSIWMSNRVESIVTFLACARQGIACNPSLHRTFTCSEVAALLERLTTKALVTEPGWGADRDKVDFEAVLSNVSSLKMVYGPENFPQSGANPLPACTDPDKVTYLAFTSGTTGTPKCVMHSDNTLLANARDLVAVCGHGPDVVILLLSPLSHHMSWVGVAQWLLSGCRIVTDDPPTGTSRLDWILENKATYLMGVPTHAMDVLTEQRARALPNLGSVTTFYMAGSPIPPSVAEAFLHQGIRPQNSYGMTENSSHQYTHMDDDMETIVSTCGRGGPAYEVQLFDSEDADVPVAAGVVGQIAGRGATLMLGYFNDQTATESSFNRDGWFLSGDLGVQDARGNLRIVGRLKDLIIRGGHNIAPAHIEALALRHDRVQRVACFPVPDERLGERVAIAVIGDVDPLKLLDHLDQEGLSKYDMPEFFVRLEALPLTASGKILKREIVEMHKRGDITPTPIRFQAN